MMRFLVAALVALLLSTPALAQQSRGGDTSLLESVDPEQRRITEEIVRDYILRNPEIVLEAIRILQAREEAAAGERALQSLAANAQELRKDPLTPISGNPEGDVTVVEFFDYACPYCRQAHPVLVELVKRDPNVRIAFKEYPILGDASVFAARVAVAIHLLAPDAYKQFHAAMFDLRGRPTSETALQIASNLGIDRERLLATMDSAEVRDALNRNIQLAQAIGVSGTPAFVVGDAVIPGLIPVEQLLELVNQARRDCTTC